MRKRGKILVKTYFLEDTLYIWKYFVLNIRADSYPTPIPQTVLLSYGCRVLSCFLRNGSGMELHK